MTGNFLTYMSVLGFVNPRGGGGGGGALGTEGAHTLVINIEKYPQSTDFWPKKTFSSK